MQSMAHAPSSAKDACTMHESHDEPVVIIIAALFDKIHLDTYLFTSAHMLTSWSKPLISLRCTFKLVICMQLTVHKGTDTHLKQGKPHLPVASLVADFIASDVAVFTALLLSPFLFTCRLTRATSLFASLGNSS